MPCVVRWPGVIKPGTVVNDIMSHEDWLPTFLAAAGDADVKTKLLTSLKAGDKTFKAHLDGYNFLPFFKGEEAKGPRHEIFYFDDSANLNALRYDDWKITFQVHRREYLQRQAGDAQHAVRRQPAPGSVRALPDRVHDVHGVDVGTR